MSSKLKFILAVLLYFAGMNLTFASINIVIFGGKGDLAMRKLYPAIYNLQDNQLIDEPIKIIALDLADETTEDFQNKLLHSFKAKDIECDQSETCKNFIKNTHYIHGDLFTDSPYLAMQKQFKAFGDSQSQTVYFLSTSFKIFGAITDRLSQHNLVNKQSKIIVEKPLGNNLESSQKIQNTLVQHFEEDQIYRIDHYLAKALVQSILTFRFKNPLFEEVWNNKHIDKVEIKAFESLGIEKRAGFYDQVGALRDMVHSHLLQLLTLIAMEEPKDFSAKAIQTEKLNLLKNIRPVTKANFNDIVEMKQYATYQSEEGVPKGSLTETYVKLKIFIDSPRWKGVPFYIYTGKKMPKKETEILVDFKADESGLDNDLFIDIDPTIAIQMTLNVLNPADRKKVLSVLLSTDETSSISNWELKDYDKLIYDVINGDNALFVSQSEIEQSWKFIDSIHKIRKELNYVPEKY